MSFQKDINEEKRRYRRLEFQLEFPIPFLTMPLCEYKQWLPQTHKH